MEQGQKIWLSVSPFSRWFSAGNKGMTPANHPFKGMPRLGLSLSTNEPFAAPRKTGFCRTRHIEALTGIPRTHSKLRRLRVIELQHTDGCDIHFAKNRSDSPVNTNEQWFQVSCSGANECCRPKVKSVALWFPLFFGLSLPQQGFRRKTRVFLQGNPTV